MTILASPSSLHASPEEPLPHIPASHSNPPVSDGWLTAWALTRAGFPCIVTIGKNPSSQTTPAPRFALHLSHPLPINALIHALAPLQSKSHKASALLLMTPSSNPESYRELLHFNDQQHVIGIRRKFRQHSSENSPLQFAGIAWKITPPLRSLLSPTPTPCWQTLRKLLQSTKNKTLPRITLPAQSPSDFRPQFLAHLPPASLRALAQELRYTPIRNFCFAPPHINIPPEALLRGPLFIDNDATILPHHIHIGPAWITTNSPALTLPTQPIPTSPTSPNDYFIGPQSRHRPAYNFLKRSFDIAFALFALLITLPICLTVAIIIKLYDRGPIFFSHRREGRHAKPFGCLKFRTMTQNADALQAKLRQSNQLDGPQFKMANDPRITPIGHFLRKSNIDELPQFLNVLVGHMSVVGPRPSPFDENQLCPAWREARLSIKPGITGLWQISRSRARGNTDFQEWILYDTQYVERQNFFLDLRIILLTLKELLGQGQ